jgi:hypothetical protein
MYLFITDIDYVQSLFKKLVKSFNNANLSEIDLFSENLLCCTKGK